MTQGRSVIPAWTWSFRLALSICFAAALVSSERLAHAQLWLPERPVELVTASGPGGNNDRVARLIQRVVQQDGLLPQPLQVINKPGGNEANARRYLNQRSGDAHVLDIASPTLITNELIGLSGIGQADVTPVALLLSEHLVIAVRADSAIRTLTQLLYEIRRAPANVPIGIINRGGFNHLAISQTVRVAGLDPRRLNIVVTGARNNMIEPLLSGKVTAIATTIPAVAGLVQSGAVRLLAVGSLQRLGGAFAGIPTLRDYGYDIRLDNWRGVIAPRQITPAQVAYWENTLLRVTSTPAWKAEVESNQWVEHFLHSQPFARFLQDEYVATRALVEELGLGR